MKVQTIKTVPVKLCPCGFPQSYPIPHEHDRTDREKIIIEALNKKTEYEKETLSMLSELIQSGYGMFEYEKEMSINGHKYDSRWVHLMPMGNNDIKDRDFSKAIRRAFYFLKSEEII